MTILVKDRNYTMITNKGLFFVYELHTKRNIAKQIQITTECLKIYRKSVLHLLKHGFAVYLSRCSTDLRYILGHSVGILFRCSPREPGTARQP